jgi:CO/xanthine dehydrogenase Mo-binding subunit
MLYHAHAEIVAIEKSEALASPGVAAIFTAEVLRTSTGGRGFADSPQEEAGFELVVPV